MRHIRTLCLLVALVGASAASTSAFDATSTYTVRQGDTLSSIANRLRVPVRSVAADAATFRAISRFSSGGQHFDGIGVDIEWTLGVVDPAARSRALVALSRQVRATTSLPLGAIVMPPVLLDVVNPGFWPGFPWR